MALAVTVAEGLGSHRTQHAIFKEEPGYSYVNRSLPCTQRRRWGGISLPSPPAAPTLLLPTGLTSLAGDRGGDGGGGGGFGPSASYSASCTTGSRLTGAQRLG